MNGNQGYYTDKDLQLALNIESANQKGKTIVYLTSSVGFESQGSLASALVNSSAPSTSYSSSNPWYIKDEYFNSR